MLYKFKEIYDDPESIVRPMFEDFGYDIDPAGRLAEIWCEEDSYFGDLMNSYEADDWITSKQIKDTIIDCINDGKAKAKEAIKKYHITSDNIFDVCEENDSSEDGLINSWTTEFIGELLGVDMYMLQRDL